MKIKKGFVLHHVCEQNVIIAEGRENIDFNNIISLNASAAFLWQHLIDKDFSTDDMARLLRAEYDVDNDVAQRDSAVLAQSWIENGLVEE